jgi:acetyl-CoA acyltransferase
MIADSWNLSRQQLDEFALASHEKAAAAQDEGRFTAQIAPVTLPDGTVVDADEGIRRGAPSRSWPASSPPSRRTARSPPPTPRRSPTAPRRCSSPTSERAAQLGLTPLVRVHTAVLAGAPPMPMLTGPIPATQKALAKAGLRADEIGAWECNEAFASVPLAWLAEIGADEKAVNPNGGAIALGHPLGGSGARLLTTLVHHMRDNGIRYGLQTMCEGGGQANATVLELM